MSNYVEGKVILITGAGSGFGRLTAQMAAEMGAKVVCSDVNEETVKETVDFIKEKKGEASYIKVDVTNKEEVNAMVKFAVEKYGCVDVLVNNAGIMPLAFFADHEKAWKAWDLCIDINFKGIVYGISAVYDQMMKQGRGQVINVSSIYGNYPVAGSGVYQATKVAVRYLTESLRVESQGVIKTTTIRPTGIPATNLSKSVINDQAGMGILGQNALKYQQNATEFQEGAQEYGDKNSPKYLTLDPDSLSQQIIYAINQPWGVSISDVTVRSTGEPFIL